MELSTLVWDGDRAPFAKAFIKAQMATEAVKKASTNPAFKSKYADLAGVVEAVVPALNAAGVGVLQFPSYDGELVGITTTFMHETGASVTSILHLRPSKNDPQGVGSAVTYGRRYALLAMSGAAPEDDDGNAASGPRSGPVRQQATSGDHPATVAQNDARKSAAACKRDGDNEKIKAEISKLTLEGVRDWYADFDRLTSHLPFSWLDPVRDMLEHRREELMTPNESEEAEAELDEGFRQAVGGPGPARVARHTGALV